MPYKLFLKVKQTQKVETCAETFLPLSNVGERRERCEVSFFIDKLMCLLSLERYMIAARCFLQGHVQSERTAISTNK